MKIVIAHPILDTDGKAVLDDEGAEKFEAKEYEFSAINRASLADLIALKKQTGLSMSNIQAMQGVLEENQAKEEYDFFEDENNLILMAVMIWLSRRKSGETNLKFEDSADVPLDWIAFVPDEVEEDESEDTEKAEQAEETSDPQ